MQTSVIFACRQNMLGYERLAGIVLRSLPSFRSQLLWMWRDCVCLGIAHQRGQHLRLAHHGNCEGGSRADACSLVANAASGRLRPEYDGILTLPMAYAWGARAMHVLMDHLSA